MTVLILTNDRRAEIIFSLDYCAGVVRQLGVLLAALAQAFGGIPQEPSCQWEYYTPLGKLISATMDRLNNIQENLWSIRLLIVAESHPMAHRNAADSQV